MNGGVLGLDVGGANLKAAYLAPGGEVPVLLERPFELWKQPDRLVVALRSLVAELPTPCRAGLTMTAELADCFASKADGVESVIRAAIEALPGIDLRVWGTDAEFRLPLVACRQPHSVAAANWLASATLAARDHRDVLLVDVGSTTTDVVPIVRGRVAADGRTDPERLRSGELVYTGALRTPVCAIVRRVRLASGWHRVAAERFAIAADARLWLRHLAPGGYTCETPDGRGVSRAEVAARLARSVCADPEMLAPGDLSRIARRVSRAQRRQIASAIGQVLERLGADRPRRFLAIGTGAFLAARAAADAGLLPSDDAVDGARYTPAAAVARLLAEQVA